VTSQSTTRGDGGLDPRSEVAALSWQATGHETPIRATRSRAEGDSRSASATAERGVAVLRAADIGGDRTGPAG
jgi:hypothetical protein